MKAMQRLIYHEEEPEVSSHHRARTAGDRPSPRRRRIVGRGGTDPLWAVLSAGGCGRKPMKLNELFADDDAVSPVIGVILMVAITVILAAVIGTFVLGLGSEVQETPAAQFTFEEGSNDKVTITHDGGDPVQADNIDVVASAGSAGDCSWTDSEVSAGTSCTTDSLSGQDGELRVTWTSDDGSTTDTLANYDYDFTT